MSAAPRRVILDAHPDMRGELFVADDLPFPVVRVFFCSTEEKVAFRGAHAHRQCEQLLIPIRGLTVVNVGVSAPKRFTLDSGSSGLYVPPGNWLDVVIYPYGTVLVLCSHRYDAADYIRDRIEFTSEFESDEGQVLRSREAARFPSGRDSVGN